MVKVLRTLRRWISPNKIGMFLVTSIHVFILIFKIVEKISRFTVDNVYFVLAINQLDLKESSE